MAVRTLTYRDLTAQQRQRGASKVRERLLGVLNHPFLTPEQRASIYTKIEMLTRWEHLAMDVKPVAAPPPPPPALPAKPPPPALPAKPPPPALPAKR